MGDVTIESLQIDVQSSSDSAIRSIENLSATLGKLKNATKGLGLTGVANQVRNLDSALKSVDGSSADKLDKLATSLQKLSGLGNFKISSSIGNQIRNIGSAATSLNGIDWSGVGNLSSALQPLNNLSKASGLQSAITQLGKLPQLASTLNSINWSQFTAQMQKFSTVIAPLTTQLGTVGNALARLPSNMRQVVSATNSLTASNNTASKSYVNLWAKLRMARVAVQTMARTVSSWITSSNEYIENVNLFTASMGKYADEAKRYAETVGEIMGIDPGEFMRNQGVFMTITKGFGVVEDRAYKMSKNLTQLGYDLSSFFNISFEDSMQKLQSGISGELEPLRRLGYDLSQARLQQEAWNLGITKSISSMTQAEKAQIRYYAIMTQVTTAQGDFSRTLSAPANQFRILKAQVIQCGRALGNIFIPVLNVVLPYLIAFAKVLRMVINLIGKFVGFELPEVDYSGISSGSSAMGDLTDNTNNAGKAAKKLKSALTGIDELNIISPNDSDTAGASGLGIGGGDLGFELPEYDFLGDAVTTKIDELVQKFKEWAGLTEDVDTWAEFFHTKLGRILILVGEIAAGFALWKLSTAFLNGMNLLHTLIANGLGNTVAVTTGIVLTITGLTIEWTGILSIIQDGIDQLNFGETIGGAIMTSIGGAFIGKGASALLSKAGITSAAIAKGMGVGLAGALFGGGIAAVVAGLPAFAAGIYSSIKEGLTFLSGFLTEFGATLTGAGAGAIGAALGAWAGPVGIGVGALIGVVVGALVNLGIYLAQNWEDVKEWIGNIGSSIKTFFTETLPGFFKGLPETISKKWNEIIQPIKDFDWKQFGYDVGKKTGEAVKKICESFKKFFTQTLPDVWKKVKESFKTFFTVTLPKFFTETIPDFFKTVKDNFVTFFTETLPDALSDIGDWFVDVGTSIWDGIKEGWDTAVKAVKDFVSGFVQGFKDALGIHSPSTVFRDEVGKFVAEGLLEGIAAPFKKIYQWVMDNIVNPIQDVVKKNPIKQGIELVKQKWETVKGWIGDIPTLEQGIKLVKEAWNTVRDWVGNIPILSQGIQLVKHLWTTVQKWVGNIPTLEQGIKLVKDAWRSVKEWIGNIPVLDQGIKLVKSLWTSVKNWIGNIPVLDQGIKLAKHLWTSVKTWVGNIPVLDQGIKLVKSLWTTVKNWIGNIPVLDQAIKLVKSAWSTVSGWVSNSLGGAVNKGIGLAKSGWSTVSGWVSNSLGGAVSVTVNLLKGWAGTIKNWLGFSGGGVITNKGVTFCADGGVFDGRIPMYANGTTAPSHGSLFVAGEAGAEMVGHIRGRTEVMNRFQLADVMYNAMIGGMSPFASAMIRQMAVSANAIVRTVLLSTNMANANYATMSSYDPHNSLAQYVYDDSSSARRASEGSMYADMRDFYRDYVEPTLREIAYDTKRQADKEEQTVVNIGGRTITETVERQQNANGYKFATT